MGCVPMPAYLMRAACRVMACVASDAHHRPTYEEYDVMNVHLQPVRADSVSLKDVKKSLTDTTLTAGMMLYADARRSRPNLDWLRLLAQAQANGGDVRVIYAGHTYTVVSAAPVCDDGVRLHHWEVALTGGEEVSDERPNE